MYQHIVVESDAKIYRKNRQLLSKLIMHITYRLRT